MRVGRFRHCTAGVEESVSIKRFECQSQIANPKSQIPDLSIIIVNWNVRDLLRTCLTSVISEVRFAKVRFAGQGSVISAGAIPSTGSGQAPCGCPNVEVIVVDNASSDGSVAMVADEFPWVKLIVNRENLGFTGGNNQGIAASRGRYVLLLNPDTVVVGDTLATMVSYMEAHPSVGVVGPQLRYGDGSLQSSCRRFPTFATALFESTPIAWHWPNNPWARHYRMEDRKAWPGQARSGDRSERNVGAIPCGCPVATSEVWREVDWLVGAALLVRRAALDQVGGFDEGYFMYSEELDLCHRIKEAGWRIVYLPSAQIIHYEGKSSEQVVAARHIRFQTSKVRYFRKFHGLVAAEVLRVFLLATFAVEWGLEAGKWSLGSKRSLRRERMAVFGQVLRSGLR